MWPWRFILHIGLTFPKVLDKEVNGGQEWNSEKVARFYHEAIIGCEREAVKSG